MHRKGQNEYPKNAIVYYDEKKFSKKIVFPEILLFLVAICNVSWITKVSKYLIQLHVNIIINPHAILKN